MAACALIAAALELAALLVSADRARDSVIAEIQAVTGLAPNLRGAVRVSTFPAGTIHFADIVLGGEEGRAPAVAAERLTARLRLLPMLLGRIEVAEITLDHATIAINIEPDGQSNWSPLLARLAKALDPATASDRGALFSEIRIADGTIHVRDAAHDLAETLTQADLVLAWPSLSSMFAATGGFRWHDEPVEMNLTLGDFLAALTGKTSNLRVRLTAAPMKVAFDGTFSDGPGLKSDGSLTVEAASLRDALRWTGSKPLPGGGFGRFSLKAKAALVGESLALSPVNVVLDGNAAEGVLSYVMTGRRMWQGTLAAEGLNLTPYVSTVRLLADSTRDWDRMPIDLDGLIGLDLDLRLSAARVTVGTAKLGRTALAANLRGGRLVLTVGESQAFNGVVTGSIAMASSEGGVDLRSQMQFAGVDLDSCLDELFGIRRFEGKGQLNFTIEGTGTSVLAITRTLNGNVTISGEQGALTGINIEHLLRRLERRPLSATGEFRSGRTPYDKFNAVVRLAQGIATVEEMHFDAPGIRLGLDGSATIPTREISLKGSASLQPTSGETPFELPFIVRGSWDDPIMLPDPDAVTRRSGVFDAAREKRTRDAVRSADRPANPAGPSLQSVK